MESEKRLKEIIRLGAELNSIQDLDILLERILLEARRVVNADAGTIYIRDGNYLIFSHAQNDTLQARLPAGKKLIYTSFKVEINSESLSGYVATTGKILNIPDVYAIPKSAPYNFDSTYDEKSNYKTCSILTVPLITNNGDIIGVLQVINEKDSKGNLTAFSPDDEPYILHFANTASIVLQRSQMTRTLLLRMNKMAELRDPKETGAHVNRVAAYAVELYERWAMYKSIPKKEIDQKRDVLRMAAMLHDVGKVAISDTILKKPGKFTEDEFNIIKTHPYSGYLLFSDKQSEFDDIAAIVALTHHENWDGTGYPGRVDEKGCIITDNAGKTEPLRGEEIPIYGRVTALADVYDALSSRRVYKEPWGEKDVLDEIKKQSGKKFDPDIIDVFFESLDFIRSIRSKYPEAAE